MVVVALWLRAGLFIMEPLSTNKAELRGILLFSWGIIGCG